MINVTDAGIVLAFDGEENVKEISKGLVDSYQAYLTYMNNYNTNQIKREAFDKYSAKAVTGVLADALNKAIIG